ncbi:MAG: hypothetical protein IKP88_17615 [Lachnospiraceae bacterium]|nr:hypothetical protein [Lachnospiraceae bacterium]
MNKRRIDSNISVAAEALKQTGIADAAGRIRKGYRGQISTFGAAIKNESLKSAIAYFSNSENGSDFKRTALMKAICYVLKVDPKKEDAGAYSDTDLYMYVDKEPIASLRSIQDKIIDAAIALKLAMNLFVLYDDNVSDSVGQGTDQQEENDGE